MSGGRVNYLQPPVSGFNMKHSRARNIIERCFGILKARWGILRHPSWYPVRTHNQVIIACCLLHNLIMRSNDSDPLDAQCPSYEPPNVDEPIESNLILTIEPTNAWSNWRDQLANEMYHEFKTQRGHL
ncbi:hypothetical protein L6164_001017 [Bauhinia variegata]|uniref:Uncharacterized protein n=1 Tax=Bauhinia variegata TaxID=167791 RepID=A0ACB9Q7Q9_BAUVA|nr:hypothetical protein L6164_001017 [Bauhinia variegata]